MTQYELPGQSPYQKPFRVVAGVAIILLLAILCIALWTPAGLSDGARKMLAWVAGAIVISAVVGANWVGFKQGFWKLKQGYRVELSDGKLIQRRSGSPLVEIPVNQISSIRQSHGGWLLVRGGQPERQIAVPPEIVGFDDLKRELSASQPIQPERIYVSPLIFLPPLAFIVAVIILFMSHSRAVVIAAGVAALLLQGFGIFSLRRTMRANPKARFVVLPYVLTFLITCWVVYERAASRF